MLTTAQITTNHINTPKSHHPTHPSTQIPHPQQRQLNDDALRALQEKMCLLRCSENSQGKDGETGNVPHWRCSPDTALAICSNRQPLQIYLNCSIMQNKPNLKNTKIDIKPVATVAYINYSPREHIKNKPNSNPIKAKLGSDDIMLRKKKTLRHGKAQTPDTHPVTEHGYSFKVYADNNFIEAVIKSKINAIRKNNISLLFLGGFNFCFYRTIF